MTIPQKTYFSQRIFLRALKKSAPQISDQIFYSSLKRSFWEMGNVGREKVTKNFRADLFQETDPGL